MKRALLLAALAVGLGAMALTRGAPPPAAPVPPERAPAPTARPAPITALSRNPFEFAARATERAPVLGAPSEHAAPGVALTPPPSPVRLVGFVRQGERLKAALVLDGETVLLAVGEAASGYTLVSADDGDGARLTAPDGSELFVSVPE